MKDVMAVTLIFSSALLLMAGCSEQKETVKKEATITTPSGKTTVTIEKETKKSGEHPPDVAP